MTALVLPIGTGEGVISCIPRNLLEIRIKTGYYNFNILGNGHRPPGFCSGGVAATACRPVFSNKVAVAYRAI